MKTFNIVVSREITESALVSVEAESEVDAFDLAIGGIHNGTLDPKWEIDLDSCGKNPLYITKVTSELSEWGLVSEGLDDLLDDL